MTVSEQSAAPGGLARLRSYLPGLGAVAVAVAVALVVSRFTGVLGPLTVAIVLGVLARNAGLLWPGAEVGVAMATKRLLRAGVVLLGLQLAVPELLQLRPSDLLVIVATVAVTFAGTRWLARRMRLGPDRALLLATGFSICGASAVAAMNSVVDGEDDDVATSVALVTIYGSLAIVLYPLLQGGLRLDDREFGIWVGASVHEVAQVVAAATVVGEAALLVAVVAKLGRVVLLAPIVAAAAVFRRRRQPAAARTPLVPLFVLGFLAMIVVRGSGVVPDPVLDGTAALTTALLAGAMFGLGAGVHVPSLVRTGGPAMLVGVAGTLLAAGTAYVGLLLLRA